MMPPHLRVEARLAAALQIALDSFPEGTPRPEWLTRLAANVFSELDDTERDILGRWRNIWRHVWSGGN